MSFKALVSIGIVLAAFASVSHAQTTAASQPDSSAIKQEELDQMLAPLALYPDSLLSQILMASTYPLEIVQADRWVKANSNLKDDALAKALESQKWDPSVKSLVNFPDVLASLSENLDWTTKIGDAFIADQKAVLATVQKLRGKAKEAGNLQSTEKMIVKTEPPVAGSSTEVIVIQSADPQVVYVPTYDPAVVYGGWWYPSYPPPVYYRPPGYYAGAAVSFGVGVACGAAWGYAWGGCDWNNNDVDIDIDRNTEFNQNINRENYKGEFNRSNIEGGKGKWNHDSSHRKGVEYRNQSAAQKYGGTSRTQASQARQSYRGYADTGRADLSQQRASGQINSRGQSDSGARDRSSNYSNRSGNYGQSSNRGAAQQRSSYDGSGSALSGSSRGSSASRDSSRGATSRQHSSGGSRSTGSRSGGGGRGGSRGGGGGRR